MSILFQIELHAFLYTNLLGVGVWSNDILFKTWQLWGFFFHVSDQPALSNSNYFHISAWSIPLLDVHYAFSIDYELIFNVNVIHIKVFYQDI